MALHEVLICLSQTSLIAVTGAAWKRSRRTVSSSVPMIKMLELGSEKFKLCREDLDWRQAVERDHKEMLKDTVTQFVEVYRISPLWTTLQLDH